MEHMISKVAILGLGTLGAQIALQTAASGYEVYAYDPDGEAFHRSLHSFFSKDKSRNKPSGACLKNWPDFIDDVQRLSSLSEAVSRADLIMEVVPENLELKLKIWREIDTAAPEHAILATNSSSLPVSKLEEATHRPENCLNLHFYQLVLGQNMADVMGGTRTTPEVLEAGKQFIRSLGMVPLQVNKELLGFCFNRVWRAIKKEALSIWANGFVDFRDLDRAWMIFTGTPWGPFGLMDGVGLDVVWDIEIQESGDPKDHPPPELRKMIDAGHMGVKTGRGFYSYPDPEFSSSDFLKP